MEVHRSIRSGIIWVDGRRCQNSHVAICVQNTPTRNGASATQRYNPASAQGLALGSWRAEGERYDVAPANRGWHEEMRGMVALLHIALNIRLRGDRLNFPVRPALQSNPNAALPHDLLKACKFLRESQLELLIAVTLPHQRPGSTERQ
jgi:hypothetical protein